VSEVTVRAGQGGLTIWRCDTGANEKIEQIVSKIQVIIKILLPPNDTHVTYTFGMCNYALACEMVKPYFHYEVVMRMG
jgi:hypothetical protein